MACGLATTQLLDFPSTRTVPFSRSTFACGFPAVPVDPEPHKMADASPSVSTTDSATGDTTPTENDPNQRVLNLSELKEMKIVDLSRLAKSLNIEGASSLKKQDLIFAILSAQTETNTVVFGEGVLEVL